MSELALQRTVVDLIAEYDEKNAVIETAITDFEAAYDRLGMSATVQGNYVEPVGSKSYLHVGTLRANLLKSGWRAVFNRLDIGAVATAKDKLLFTRTLADPPPLTLDNAKATFGDYLIRPRFHILRGLAEVFTTLDPAYKSHSNVRVGVKGLPKRIILSGWGEYSSGYARDRFGDMINALAAYRGQPHFEFAEMSAINAAHDVGEDAVLDGRSYTRKYRDKDEIFSTVDRGLTVRKFGNGNAHVIFDKWAMLDINKALAEFYGEVLPDAEEEGATIRPGTDVSKDLQFYWSPQAVIEAALDYADIHTVERWSGRQPEYRVLEPSCGDGRMLDELRARGCRSLGFEYHAERAAQAKAKGHSVVTANFLEQPPTPDFDRVVMNPPFYGRHYAKHVKHALKFLKPGGTLVSILPATAHYDHGDIKGEWRDLPVGSFSEAGTNVPTGLMRIVNRVAA